MRAFVTGGGRGIGSGEIIETVHARRSPMMPVSVSLQL
jgi:hypothetical protein